jgi:hypothetical protein
MRSIRLFSSLLIALLLVPNLAAARPSLRGVKEAGTVNKTSAQQKNTQNRQQAISSAQSTDEIRLTRYSHVKLGVTTQVPSAWNVSETDYLFTDPKADLVGIFRISFSDPVSKELRPSIFTIDLAPQGVAMSAQDVDAYVSKLWNYDVKNQKVIDPDKPMKASMSTVTVSATKIGGYEGKVYSYTTTALGDRRTVTQTIIPVGMYLYTFSTSLTDERLEKGLPAYNTMLSSTVFTKPVLSAGSSSSKSSKASIRMRKPTGSSVSSRSINQQKSPRIKKLSSSSSAKSSFRSK